MGRALFGNNTTCPKCSGVMRRWNGNEKGKKTKQCVVCKRGLNINFKWKKDMNKENGGKPKGL